MPKKSRVQGKAPKTCPECGQSLEGEGRPQISDVLSAAIVGFEQRIKAKDFRPTVGDYLKLLQLTRELDADAPKQIAVRWIDGDATQAENAES